MQALLALLEDAVCRLYLLYLKMQHADAACRRDCFTCFTARMLYLLYCTHALLAVLQVLRGRCSKMQYAGVAEPFALLALLHACFTCL
jgi:hypothetical protein